MQNIELQLRIVIGCHSVFIWELICCRWWEFFLLDLCSTTAVPSCDLVLLNHCCAQLWFTAAQPLLCPAVIYCCAQLWFTAVPSCDLCSITAVPSCDLLSHSTIAMIVLNHCCAQLWFTFPQYYSNDSFLYYVQAHFIQIRKLENKLKIAHFGGGERWEWY